MVSRRLRARGFTLIEAIIVIVITGIVGSMVAVFIKAAIDSYYASVRRGELTDMADVTLRRIEREIRLAVPNSLRMTTSGNVVYLEFVPTKDGGRYRNESDGSTGSSLNNLCSGGTTQTKFDVLGPLPSVNAGDFIVIFNDASLYDNTSSPSCNTPSNVYCGGNRAKVGGTEPLTSPLSIGALANSNIICSYGNNRFAVVASSGPVTYACPTVSSGELRRYAGYGFNSAQPVPPGGASALMTEHATCTIDYNQTAMRRIGLLYITLTLTRDGESITTFREIHVDNAP